VIVAAVCLGRRSHAKADDRRGLGNARASRARFGAFAETPRT